MQSLWIVGREALKEYLETGDACNVFVTTEMRSKLPHGSHAYISPPSPFSHFIHPILTVLFSLLPGKHINSGSTSLLTLHPKHIFDEKHDHQYSSSGYRAINIHGDCASSQIHPATRITVGGRAGHAQVFRPLFIRGPVQASISEQNLPQWQLLFILHTFPAAAHGDTNKALGLSKKENNVNVHCVPGYFKIIRSLGNMYKYVLTTSLDIIHF